MEDKSLVLVEFYSATPEIVNFTMAHTNSALLETRRGSVKQRASFAHIAYYSVGNNPSKDAVYFLHFAYEHDCLLLIENEIATIRQLKFSADSHDFAGIETFIAVVQFEFHPYLSKIRQLKQWWQKKVQRSV
jgi:hypothetical protein